MLSHFKNIYHLIETPFVIAIECTKSKSSIYCLCADKNANDSFFLSVNSVPMYSFTEKHRNILGVFYSF